MRFFAVPSKSFASSLPSKYRIPVLCDRLLVTSHRAYSSGRMWRFAKHFVVCRCSPSFALLRSTTSGVELIPRLSSPRPSFFLVGGTAVEVTAPPQTRCKRAGKSSESDEPQQLGRLRPLGEPRSITAFVGGKSLA